jgi:CheY-like chemotaxis protein/HPt (histidine-containing phosphotransfer) domain-containing protein
LNTEKLPGSILVVDDQPLFREQFSIILEKLGHEYILANDGKDALEKIQINKPAIVFLDMQMPIMNGHEAVKKIRELGFQMPIIAATAEDDSGDQEPRLEAGINDMLTKPFKRAAIERMLQKWMNTTGTVTSAKDSDVSPDTKDYVFDAKNMLDTFLNNEEIALPLLSRFIERTKGQIKNFPALEKKEDWDNAYRDAHLIKGAALTMGGSELGKAALILEQAVKAAKIDEIDAAFIELRKAFKRFKKEAEMFLSSRS